MACTYTIKETGQKLSENEFKAYLLNGGLQSFVDANVLDLENEINFSNKPPKPPVNTADNESSDSDENFLKEYDLRVSKETSPNASKVTLENMGYPIDLLEVSDSVETLKLELRKEDANDIINKAKQVWGDDIRIWGKNLYQKALGLVRDLDKSIDESNAKGEKQIVTMIALRRELTNAMNDLTNRINFSETKDQQELLKKEQAEVQNILRQVNETVEKLGNNASRRLSLFKIEKGLGNRVAVVTNIKNKVTGETIANQFDIINDAIREEIGIEENEQTVEQKEAEIKEDLQKERKNSKRTVSQNAKNNAAKNQTAESKLTALAKSIKEDMKEPINKC